MADLRPGSEESSGAAQQNAKRNKGSGQKKYCYGEMMRECWSNFYVYKTGCIRPPGREINIISFSRDGFPRAWLDAIQVNHSLMNTESIRYMESSFRPLISWTIQFQQTCRSNPPSFTPGLYHGEKAAQWFVSLHVRSEKEQQPISWKKLKIRAN